MKIYCLFSWRTFSNEDHYSDFLADEVVSERGRLLDVSALPVFRVGWWSTPPRENRLVTLHSYNIQKYLWTLIFNEVLVWKRVCYRVTDVFSCSFLVKQLLFICLEYECMYVNLDPIIVISKFVLVFTDFVWIRGLNCWTYYYVVHLFWWCGGVSISSFLIGWFDWVVRSRVQVHSAVRAAAQWVCSHSFSSQNLASHQQLLRLAHATQLSIVRPQYHSQLA